MKEIKVGDSVFLICALATLDRWIALGEQLMVCFKIVGKAQWVRELWRATRN